MKTKSCSHCSAEFVPLGSRSKYCSIRCVLLGNSKDETSGCREWQKALGSHGYGVLNSGAGVHTAHRLMYQLAQGPVPDGLFVLHRCGNRKCINPEHLYAGTPKQNSADMVAHGRHWNKGRELEEWEKQRLRLPRKKNRLAEAMRNGA